MSGFVDRKLCYRCNEKPTQKLEKTIKGKRKVLAELNEIQKSINNYKYQTRCLFYIELF